MKKTGETVERSSCCKDEKENDGPDSFQSMLESFTAKRLLNIIVGGAVPEEKLCKLVPKGIRNHSAFIVDNTCIYRKQTVREKSSIYWSIYNPHDQGV